MNERSLGALLQAGGLQAAEDLDVETVVTEVTDDSRRVKPGSLYVAVPGTKVDGAEFIPEAAERGALAVVAEAGVRDSPIPIVPAPSARRALALMGHAFHGHPSRRLLTVGVTGTNGKTSTTLLLEAVMRASGHTPGVIGTIDGRLGERRWPAPTTTPHPVTLAATLAEMVELGGDALAIEVSSHAIDQHRVVGVDFDAGIFTNLSQDHLDYHGTMEVYADVKRRFFTELLASRSDARAVVNLDEPLGEEIASAFDGPVVTYGRRAGANVRVVEHRPEASGGMVINLEVLGESWTLRTRLVGGGNVMNIAAVTTWAQSEGIDAETIQRGLDQCTCIPGRLETVAISDGQPFRVIVDYSHTPASLEGALRLCREMLESQESSSHLAVVFGCGGDRDRQKRPIMGEIAGRLADQVWLTSDNPRTEDPNRIIDEALVGLQRSPRSPDEIHVDADRREAIRSALAAAGPGDIVLIAGKGHETYQEIGTERFPFDDAEVAREWMRENLN